MVFLANRANLRNKRLHRRVRTRLQNAAGCRAVQLRVATHREPGPYRVVAETDPRQWLETTDYPVQTGRLQVGVDVETGTEYDHYWINWIEPERQLLLGWHQDTDHPDLGPVHLQLVHGDAVIDRESAEFVDDHPLAVLEVRLGQLSLAIGDIEWEDDRPLSLHCR
jgi:hypothetical protein